jgi:hypothetical protein
MSAITSIFGAAQGASAITDATKAQILAMLQAASTVQGAVPGENQQIQSVNNNANADLMSATEGAIGGVNGASKSAADMVLNAVRDAKNGVYDARDRSNEQLNPYAEAGWQGLDVLKMLQSGGLSADSVAASPAVQFRLSEGQKAIERSAAARGGLNGGAALKSLTRYSQGVASDEYGKEFDRRAGVATGLTGLGFNAATHIGANNMGAAEYAGNADITGNRYAGDTGLGAAEFAGRAGMATAGITGDRNISTQSAVSRNNLTAADFAARMQLGIGDAQAGEHLGRANAWNGMLSSIGRTADSALAGGFGGAGGGFSAAGALYGALGIPRRRNTGGMPGGQY